MNKFYMKASQVWENSYSVFERDRTNDLGEPYCVDPGLSYSEARERVDQLNRESSIEAGDTAAFIVRACNSHEALKKFAEWVLRVEPENSLLALNARHALKSIA